MWKSARRTADVTVTKIAGHVRRPHSHEAVIFFRIFGIHSFLRTTTLLNICICMRWAGAAELCTHAVAPSRGGSRILHAVAAVSRDSRMLHAVAPSRGFPAATYICHNYMTTNSPIPGLGLTRTNKINAHHIESASSHVRYRIIFLLIDCWNFSEVYLDIHGIASNVIYVRMHDYKLGNYTDYAWLRSDETCYTFFICNIAVSY